MWAQMVKLRVPGGNMEGMRRFNDNWDEKVGRQPGSPWVKTLTFQNQNDAEEYYVIAFFESEEGARENEKNPAHIEAMQGMSGLVAGEPSFVDLIPISETSR